MLFVSFVTPHYPLLAPEEFYALYDVENMPLPKAGSDSGFKPHEWLANYVQVTDAANYSEHQHRVAMAAYLEWQLWNENREEALWGLGTVALGAVVYLLVRRTRTATAL